MTASTSFGRRRGAGLALGWELARRFLTGGKSRVLAGTARAAILSIAIGVAALVIAMALMSGYRHDLERRLLAGSAAVGVFPPAEPLAGEDPVALLGSIDGVASVGRVVYGRGSLSSSARLDGLDVTLRGVDPAGAGLAGQPVELVTGDDGLPPIALGAELASALGVTVDDVARLTVLEVSGMRPRFRYVSVRVSEIFASGYFEFDRSWAVLGRGLLEELTGLGSTYELTLVDPRRADAVAAEARRRLGPEYEVRNFRLANEALFEALRWQQLLLFLVLSLIVVVSTFNVASTLVVLVRERMRQLGVLVAVGMRPGQLGSIFLLYGVLVGVVGVASGLAAGSLVAWVLDEFEIIRLGSGLASIYFLSSVPFRVEATDLVVTGAFALLVTLGACALPARRAMRLDPAAALRHQ